MRYWLMKSEPDVYSWDDLVKEKKGTWDGVRNYQARNNLQLMQKGDLAFFYHSNIGLEIVGIMEIVEEAFQDPSTEDTKWKAVRVKPKEKLPSPVSLSRLKQDPLLTDMPLIRHTRLSVMPLTEEHWVQVLEISRNVSVKEG